MCITRLPSTLDSLLIFSRDIYWQHEYLKLRSYVRFVLPCSNYPGEKLKTKLISAFVHPKPMEPLKQNVTYTMKHVINVSNVTAICKPLLTVNVFIQRLFAFETLSFPSLSNTFWQVFEIDLPLPSHCRDSWWQNTINKLRISSCKENVSKFE